MINHFWRSLKLCAPQRSALSIECLSFSPLFFASRTSAIELRARGKCTECTTSRIRSHTPILSFYLFHRDKNAKSCFHPGEKDKLNLVCERACVCVCVCARRHCTSVRSLGDVRDTKIMMHECTRRHGTLQSLPIQLAFGAIERTAKRYIQKYCCR